MSGRLEALRRDAEACLEAALAAVEPERLVEEFLASNPRLLANRGGIRIAGIGKAAAAMARGAAAALADFRPGPVRAVLVVPQGQGRRVPEGAEIFEGGHPIPNASGVAGATAIRRLAEGSGEDELFLVLISGGGSALMTLPPEGVSLEDVQATTAALLEAGADIGELNAVRKHVDRLKGGQLARTAAPAQVVALVLSDVVGDPLDVIASGPVSPDTSTFETAAAVLRKFDLWTGAPQSVRRHLEQGLAGSIAETPKAGDPCFTSCSVHIVGNNAMAAEAACREAERRGYSTRLASTTVTGEARDVGAALARRALEIDAGAGEIQPPACLVQAGETTVTVTGSGRGGRNQELALGAAIELERGRAGHALIVASAGTDGIDGPTDAAGAIATPDTTARARALGLDARAALANNDSHAFFAALGDLIVTGPTGTNVMDLQFVLVR